ncbi:hypothetical protein CPC08DRAFT_95314 [Agrocybe pediades]|nr:hypothetical protein CPC08DRAFT_95314 [Agrocybe pediades]
MSAATAQIRALENSVFDKESANHSLQKQILALEEQLSKLRSSSRLAGTTASGHPSRPSSRAMDVNDARRSSFNSHRPNNQPLSRTIFDHVMTPETMHKRKVSLSMLKARIDSENKSPMPPSRALSPVHSENGHAHARSHPHSRTTSVTGSHIHNHRPQFLDESHVFWCHSCKGDLVIL